MDYEKLIRELVDKKAEQDNQIDLHAYENGMRAFAEANAKLMPDSTELLEVLMMVNSTLYNHGHVDAETDLHYKLEQAIKKATL